MNKKQLLALITKKNTAKEELRGKIEACEDVKQLKVLQTEWNSLNDEIRELQTMADAIPDETVPPTAAEPFVSERTKAVNDEIPGVVLASTKGQEQRNVPQGIDSPEYRSAFLKTLQGKELTEDEKRSFTLVPNTGGAAVPTETANMIFDQMTKIAPMLREIQLLRVAGNLRFAVQGVRNPATIHAEGAAVAPAEDTMVTVTLSGFEFIKVIRISQTIQTMAINAFETWIVKIIGEDIAVLIDNQIINGGTVTGNIATAQVWVDGVNQVTYVPGTGLTYKDITTLISLLPSAFDRNAKFVMRKSTFYGQVLGMVDSTGKPIVVQDVANSGVYSILGYPVLIDDNVAANEAYLGNFKQVVGNLAADITISRSAESGFLNNTVDFRGTAIFDCDIAQPAAIVKLNVL